MDIGIQNISTAHYGLVLVDFRCLVQFLLLMFPALRIRGVSISFARGYIDNFIVLAGWGRDLLLGQ